MSVDVCRYLLMLNVSGYQLMRAQAGRLRLSVHLYCFSFSSSIVRMVVGYFGKQRIIQLYFQRKISFGQISRILQSKGLNIPRQTIWLIVRKY